MTSLQNLVMHTVEKKSLNSAENYAITDNYAYNESGINKIHRESTALYTTTQIACLDAL